MSQIDRATTIQLYSKGDAGNHHGLHYAKECLGIRIILGSWNEFGKALSLSTNETD